MVAKVESLCTDGALCTRIPQVSEVMGAMDSVPEFVPTSTSRGGGGREGVGVGKRGPILRCHCWYSAPA